MLSTLGSLCNETVEEFLESMRKYEEAVTHVEGHVTITGITDQNKTVVVRANVLFSDECYAIDLQHIDPNQKGLRERTIYGSTPHYEYEVQGNVGDSDLKVTRLARKGENPSPQSKQDYIALLKYHLQPVRVETAHLIGLLQKAKVDKEEKEDSEVGTGERIIHLRFSLPTEEVVNTSKGLKISQGTIRFTKTSHRLPSLIMYAMQTKTATGEGRTRIEYEPVDGKHWLPSKIEESEVWQLTSGTTIRFSRSMVCRFTLHNKPIERSRFTLSAFGLPEPPWLTPATPEPAGVPWTLYGVAVGFGLLIVCILLSRRKATA
jgi:hypothetical protein